MCLELVCGLSSFSSCSYSVKVLVPDTIVIQLYLDYKLIKYEIRKDSYLMIEAAALAVDSCAVLMIDRLIKYKNEMSCIYSIVTGRCALVTGS